ncbi:MAG: glycosyltransferase family 4 protein [Betaproteobacteria bacterium]|nr:glycosyltransferase family 4 protein [Betaproteobacteria bacterium]
MDRPNERSLHSTIRPRVGGAGLLAGAAAALWILSPAAVASAPWIWILGGCMLALFLLSLADDLVGLNTWIRLACHALVALAFLTIVEAGPTAPWMPTAWAAAACVAGGVWWTNLNNFMDGADGLAGGMATFGLLSLGLVALTEKPAGEAIGLLALALSGASAGFLLLNFQPARVFMGDAGSIPLGFAAAALSWLGTLHALWPWWFGPAVFSVFIVDATVTLLRRIASGQRFWQAHRDHYYQRLILAGWSHRRTCVVYYFLMLASTICALLAKSSTAPWTWLTGVVITYAALIAVCEWRFHQEKQDRKVSGAR